MTTSETKLLKLLKLALPQAEGQQKQKQSGSYDAKQLEEDQEKQNQEKQNQKEHPLEWSLDWEQTFEEDRLVALDGRVP